MTSTDWVRWHERYDDPDSALSRRLAEVRGHIRDWLDRTSPQPVRVLSACAGDGRDLLGVLAARHDAARVTATLLELDERNVAAAQAAVAELGAAHIGVRQVDAGRSDAYAAHVPAQLVLLCGIFGNVSDADVERTARLSPMLCAPGATVLWTRHRRPPDLTPAIRTWFEAAGFEELAFDSPGEGSYVLGVARLVGPPTPFESGLRLFSFTN